MNNNSLGQIIGLLLNLLIGIVRAPLFLSAAMLIVLIPLLLFGENASYNFLYFLPGLGGSETITEVLLLKSLGLTSLIFSYSILILEKIFKKSLIRISYKFLLGIYSVGYIIILSIFYIKNIIPFGFALFIFVGFWLLTVICIAGLSFLEDLKSNKLDDYVREK